MRISEAEFHPSESRLEGHPSMLPYVARRAVWLTAYLVLVLAPVLALLLGDVPPARGFWTEFSSAIAYAGLMMMGLQFGLTARFRYVTEPWGEDVIYHFHRLLSLVALGLVIAHPIILFAIDPARLRLLNFFQAPPVARWAALSTYSLIALVAMSLWRVRLRIRYEIWHSTHILLAVVAHRSHASAPLAAHGTSPASSSCLKCRRSSRMMCAGSRPRASASRRPACPPGVTYCRCTDT